MKIVAFIQMGDERRETMIEIPDDEYRAGLEWVRAEPNRRLETWLEAFVLEWLEHQYGWGWSGAGYVNDFGGMEGSNGAGLVTVAESAIPNTRRVQSRSPGSSSQAQ